MVEISADKWLTECFGEILSNVLILSWETDTEVKVLYADLNEEQLNIKPVEQIYSNEYGLQNYFTDPHCNP